MKAFHGSNKNKSRKDKRKENSFSLLLQLIFTSFSRLFLFIVFIVKPIAVHITTREKFVSAEKRYDVECKSSGSRPEASLTWWKGSRQIKRMAKNVCSTSSLTTKKNFSFNFKLLQFSETGNQTLSVLTFIPVVDDDGKYLTCRAENAFIPDSAIEDKWRLVVHCKFLFSSNLHHPRSFQNMTFHQHRYRRMKIMNPFNFALLLVAIHTFFSCETSLNTFIQRSITTASTITVELQLN